MTERFEEQAKVFKAFDDGKRLRILALLHGGERCALELIEEMGMPQSTLAYHMKMLCDSGVVTGRQAGKWTYYRISTEGGAAALALLNEILNVSAKPTGQRKRATQSLQPAAQKERPALTDAEQPGTEQPSPTQTAEHPRNVGSSWSDDFFID